MSKKENKKETKKEFRFQPLLKDFSSSEIDEYRHRKPKPKRRPRIESIEIDIVEDSEQRLQRLNAKIDKIQRDIDGIQSGLEQFINNVEYELENIVAYNCYLSDLSKSLKRLKAEIKNVKKGN